MAKIIWTEPALEDLHEITDHISIDDPNAAERFADRIFSHVQQLEAHPLSGPVPDELEDERYRQLIEPPARVFYRFDGETVLILHVLRFERILKLSRLQ